MNPPAPYAPPPFRTAIELDLSRNEGRAPRDLDFAAAALSPTALARYPDLLDLQCAIAARHGVAVDQVLLTAGGDDALLRVCLLALAPGRHAIVPTPTFEMLARYVAMARAEARELPWPEGPFPTAAVLAAANEDTALVFVVSPNNPTGAIATVDDLERLAAALPKALIVLDAAYAEFADCDLTAAALRLPNVVVVRTLSKAWALAGLRVGYALGTAEQIRALASYGNPMPVSIASARLALARLHFGVADVDDHVACVHAERRELLVLLRELGCRAAEPAQANFVLARGIDAAWLTTSAATLGIALRRFPRDPQLRDAVRIGLPGEPAGFARLRHALTAALQPQALLFDLDGVLADVSGSYRQAIVAAASDFGVAVGNDDIERAKAAGNANCDYALTCRLLQASGVAVVLAAVVERFDAHYAHLARHERLLLDGDRLDELRRRFRLAIVTGRPRAEAIAFLERFDLRHRFDALVCREDAALKPDPAPVRLALEQLGVRTAWMLGDTIDDVLAARGAGVIPLGVVAPGTSVERATATLLGAGAARVLANTTELMEILP
jgi:histidinol-phosphate aminotransferase